MESVASQVVAVEVALATLIAGGIAFPRSRSWPPPRLLSWQWLVGVMLMTVAVWGVLALAVLDWNQGPLPTQIRFALGVPLLVAGEALAIWSIKALGLRNAMGSMERLVTTGPYGFSRNPEYVGETGVLMGFAVVANAPAALAATALLAGCLFLAIRAEEKALVDRFGHLYEDYAGRVGRIFVNPPNGPDPQLDGPEPGGTP